MLSAEEYFDPDDRPYSIDSLPRFDHAVDYLDANREQISATSLTVIDSDSQQRRLIGEAFWHHGKNRVIERIDETDSPYWEMIVESQIRLVPMTTEILRIGRDAAGRLVPLSHVFLTEEEDGSHSEEKLLPKR